MMDITLYVTMDLPLAQLRDHLNRFPDKTPIDLTIGIPVRLNFVLFKGRDYDTAPYQLPEGIMSWSWAVDHDFDRTTSPLMEGDNAQIEVVTSDTETRIKVPNTVYSTALSEMLGKKSHVDGFIGELDGYDADGNCTFCLQVPNIAVWNRIAGD